MTIQAGKFCALIVFSTLLLCGSPAFGGTWKLTKPVSVHSGSAATVTLKAEGFTSNTKLWLEAHPPGSTVLPDFVDASSTSVNVPVFPRDSAQSFIVHDASDDVISTVTLPIHTGPGWEARVQVSGVDHLPVLYANLPTTLTLNLKGGQGAQPQSAHISLVDRSGRQVYARFYNTFEMLGGMATMRAPASGLYELRACFYEEPVTSMPRSALRDSVPIPYGLTAANLPGLPDKEWGVTTQTVVGSVVSLEEIPTTATLAAEDRFPVAAFAATSSEFKLNKWPFAINAGIMGIPAQDAGVLMTLQQMTGAGFVPVSFPWSAIQVGPDSYRWDLLQNVLKSYRSQKIRPIINITGPSAWSGETAIQSPESRRAWITMLRELGRSYRKTIWGLQVWPNWDLDWPSDSEAADYRNLLQATWEGFMVQGDGAVAPGPPLIVGGGVGLNTAFLDAIITSQTAPMINGLAFQLRPKTAVSSPEESGYPEILQQAQQFASTQELTDPKLYLNGFEWESGPGGVTELEQANYLTRTLVYAVANNFYKITWNSLADHTSSGVIHRAGLFRGNLTAKPAAIAYNVSAFMLSGAKLASTRPQGKAMVFEFNITQQSNKWPSRLYVAWTNSPHEKEVVSLNMTLGGGYFIQDYLGQEIAPDIKINGNAHALTGPITVPVSFEPIFIWDAGKPPGLQNGTPKSIE